jgi:hypothetical protein
VNAWLGLDFGVVITEIPISAKALTCSPLSSVVRPWNTRADGPGGNTVFLTHASGEKPWQPFDDDDERRLIEHGCLKESQPPWRVKHPPQNTARAGRVHVLLTWLMWALARAYRRPCEPEEGGAAPLGWQRWRHQLLEQTRDQVIVWAQGHDGIWHRAESSRLLGAKLKDVPPGIGALPDVLARYGLTAHG